MSKKSLGGDHPAIEVRGPINAYGDNRVLGGIERTVRCGQVFGFVGPSGAGTTTTIRILTTLTPAGRRDRPRPRPQRADRGGGDPGRVAVTGLGHTPMLQDVPRATPLPAFTGIHAVRVD
ncbi:hypothetical protein ETD86_19835 [Nonomuraea turkmeniaca]|uniref:ATP-binding cassette domain-containing protein n=1 Tax=Nonomuraea turkmeniaca TaxID=103838 RepID=A0A5S4FHM1_9ACTN|nr:ATP-binding cassette domain-containing protein [Nonomuraea turkmeniaca]TMR19418.1 hypothetical protein ETD86_19835 [Nonomuraea turkmeniaca]